MVGVRLAPNGQILSYDLQTDRGKTTRHRQYMRKILPEVEVEELDPRADAVIADSGIPVNEEVIADQPISSRLRARKALQGSGNFWEYLSQDEENTVPATGQASITSQAGNQTGGQGKMAFKCSVFFALCLYAGVVSLGLIIAVAAGVHSAGPLSCPVEGNTGMVDNVVKNTYHFDVLNNDESQLIKEGVGCPKVLERTNTCNTLNGWQISEILILLLLCFNVLCHWSNITHWHLGEFPIGS